MIEDKEVIKKILEHLGLWELNPRPPTKARGLPKFPEYSFDRSSPQIPASDNCLYVDLGYLSEA